MTETWVIGTEVIVPDPTTFVDVRTITPVVYTGKGRFRPSGNAVSEPVVAEQVVAVTGDVLSVPVGTTGLHGGMVARCTASPDDAGLVGREVRLKGSPSSGQVTAQRWAVEEVTGG